MARPAQFLRWQQTLSTYLPHLSRPQVTVLALWSLGLILAHSCGLTTVATVLAYLLGRREGVVRGCAIPVAWKVVEATRAGAWRPHWIALFEALDGSIPADWTVIVQADRGLYARWLFTTIQARGWHPFLRINRQGQYRPQGTTCFRSLSQVVTRVGQPWAGRVTCFATKERQLDCTLRARWEAGDRAPWLILTDRAPRTADVAWYGLRAWIECGLKDSKRGGR